MTGPARLWFAAPPGRITGEPHDRGGPDLASVTADGVWVVAHVSVDDEAWPAWVADELPGLLGGAVEAAAWFAVESGAELPPALHTWGTARDVPADAIGPGTPTVMMIDGAVRLAAYWSYGPVRVTATVTDAGMVCTLAPSDVTFVRLRTVAHRERW